ncbi:hypothetical protein SynMINOS11_01655 [Synechococcus sp. Minos11]|nr:hypothetical protein SynMINOS11_01655 [Synechococcus sp. Minos11]
MDSGGSLMPPIVKDICAEKKAVPSPREERQVARRLPWAG